MMCRSCFTSPPRHAQRAAYPVRSGLCGPGSRYVSIHRGVNGASNDACHGGSCRVCASGIDTIVGQLERKYRCAFNNDTCSGTGNAPLQGQRDAGGMGIESSRNPTRADRRQDSARATVPSVIKIIRNGHEVKCFPFRIDTARPRGYIGTLEIGRGPS